MKIVYNACFGGFSLSRAAVLRAREISGNPGWGGPTIKGDRYEDGSGICDSDFGHVDVERHDPVLVQAVEELGDAANGSCARLRIAEIGKGNLYRIDEYDGNESVETPDSYAWKVAE